MNNDFNNNGFNDSQQSVNNFNNIPENTINPPINIMPEQSTSFDASNEVNPQPIQININSSQQINEEPVIQQPVSFNSVPVEPVMPTPPELNSEPQGFVQNANQISSDYNKPKNNKIIIFIIIAIVVGAAIFLAVKFLGGKSSSEPGAVFSDGAPIRIKKDKKYGYISTNGDVVIPFKYDDAWDFVGDYAKVREWTEVDGKEDDLYQVIDTKGNTVFSTTYSSRLDYYEDYNIWVLDGKLFDSSLKQLSPDGTKVGYDDHGYLRWDNDKSAGIMDYTGKVTYTYNFIGDESYLGLTVSDNDSELKETYCIVNVGNEKYAIVNCDTGVVVYDFTNYYIAEEDDNIFELSIHSGSSFDFVSRMYIQDDRIIYETKDKGIELYCYPSKGYVEIKDTNKPYSEMYSYINILNGEITQERPSVTPAPAVNKWEEYTNYTKRSCDDYGYSLVKGETIVVPCSWDRIDYFDLNLYKYLVSKGKDYVLAEKDDKTYLIDLKTGQSVEEFNSDYIGKNDHSTFIYYKDDSNNTRYIYNLINGKTFTTDSDSNISAHFNYFTLSKNGKVDYYNMDYKLIYTENK